MSVNMDMNILIVDDFKTMLQIMGSLLKQLGFKNIDEADSGTSALEKLRSGKDYGLIISDWNMEPVSGYQLLKEGTRPVEAALRCAVTREMVCPLICESMRAHDDGNG